MKGLAAMLILMLVIAGHEPPASNVINQGMKMDSGVVAVPQATVIPVPDSIVEEVSRDEPNIQTGTLNPVSLVDYAKTLIGTPYLYGSTDPKKGFDCSGFITYVFNHFNVKVPRSSVEFTHVGNDVNYMMAKPGDLILFTGTDSTIRVVGHMGIIVNNENNKVYFIHSSSGKQYGVIVTELNPYYLSRFVRIARVFPANASHNPLEPSNRLMLVDSTRHISRIKTIQLNKLDSVKNSKSNNKKVASKRLPASKSTRKKKATASNKRTKRTSASKKKTSTTHVKKAASSVKKSSTASKKKHATKK